MQHFQDNQEIKQVPVMTSIQQYSTSASPATITATSMSTSAALITAISPADRTATTVAANSTVEATTHTAKHSIITTSTDITCKHKTTCHTTIPDTTHPQMMII